MEGIGALCFDRILLYLESELKGCGPEHAFDLEVGGTRRSGVVRSRYF